MKKLLIIGLLFFALTAGAQQRAVEKAVEQLNKAILEGDSAALMRLTHKDLSYGHSGGKLEDRKEFVHQLAAGISDFKTLELTDQTVTLVKKTAVVRHTLHADIVDKGNAVTINLLVILVWVRDNGSWKLLARQAVKKPA